MEVLEENAGAAYGWQLRQDVLPREEDVLPMRKGYPAKRGRTSSLLKAGILPRLSGHIEPVYVECTPAGTETQLLAALRGRFPDLPSRLGVGPGELLDAVRGRILGGDLPGVAEVQPQRGRHAGLVVTAV